MSLETKLSKLRKVIDKLNNGVKSNYQIWCKNLLTKHVYFHFPYTVLLVDAIIAALSLFISICCITGFDFKNGIGHCIFICITVFALTLSSIFVLFGISKINWKDFKLNDIPKLFGAISFANLLFFPMMVLINQNGLLPYSVIFINFFISCCLLISPRLIFRLIRSKATENEARNPVIMIGSLSSLDKALKVIEITLKCTPLGLITLNADEMNDNNSELPILGTISNLSTIFKLIRKRNIKFNSIVIIDSIISDDNRNTITQYTSNNKIDLLHLL